MKYLLTYRLSTGYDRGFDEHSYRFSDLAGVETHLRENFLLCFKSDGSYQMRTNVTVHELVPLRDSTLMALEAKEEARKQYIEYRDESDRLIREDDEKELRRLLMIYGERQGDHGWEWEDTLA